MEHNSPKSKFKWTDYLVSLYEIAEGVLLMGSVNHGKIKKNEFMKYLGEVFGVDLSKHKDLFTGIQRRNESPDGEFTRVSYLKQMIEALDEKLKALEDKRNKLR